VTVPVFKSRLDQI
jgi:hypothetical protein